MLQALLKDGKLAYEKYGITEAGLDQFEGLFLGHLEDLVNITGVTVLVSKEGFAAAVDVRGGGPASRETTLLDTLSTADKIHAIVLSGGSAFGLEASSGVMQYLEENGVGFDTGYAKVPLVCQSCIYDLSIGSSKVRPDKKMGYEACKNAFEKNDWKRCGNVGVGTGATCGKSKGNDYQMKSGFGYYGLSVGSLKVLALVVVNCHGDVFSVKTHEKIAGMLNTEKNGLDDSTLEFIHQLIDKERDNLFVTNTTLGIVITNAEFNKMQLKRIASACHNAYARTISPIHTSGDGDSIYAVSGGKNKVSANIDLVSVLSQEAMACAINRAVLRAESISGIPSSSDIFKKMNKSTSNEDI